MGPPSEPDVWVYHRGHTITQKVHTNVKYQGCMVTTAIVLSQSIIITTKLNNKYGPILCNMIVLSAFSSFIRPIRYVSLLIMKGN